MSMRAALLLGFALTAPAACAPVAPVQDLRAATLTCPVGEQGLTALQLRPEPADVAELGITWSADVKSDERRLAEYFRLEGPCAPAIGGFVMGQGALRSGQVFTVDPEKGVGAGLERAAATLLDTSVEPSAAPRLGGAKFVMSDRVNYRRSPKGALIQDHLGLWRDGGRSIVAAFSEIEPGAYGRPRIVFSSRSALRAISYFPAPDTAAGRIGVVEDAGGGAVRLLGWGWSHQGWFPVR